MQKRIYHMDRAEIVELIGELREELAGISPPTPGAFGSVHEWTSLAQTIIDLEKIVGESASSDACTNQGL